MQDRYVADEARVSISSLEAETIMKSTPVQTVKSILGRIGIEYEDGLPKEAYISALKEEFCFFINLKSLFKVGGFEGVCLFNESNQQSFGKEFLPDVLIWFLRWIYFHFAIR